MQGDISKLERVVDCHADECIKNVWAWLWVGQCEDNVCGLVGCHWISHHIPISFSFPEILHIYTTCISTNTVLIQS